ncbi:hypothetical protein [Haloarcula nitratireducens]|uniref:Uncharacterized protein n=1 Tax=Haloarcula nitratireducens TaxID=2487749 RepID=A0AAW4P7R7_9EURY|nr:hypothetical protein [Halomicroarcula nitratireducens]MBX0293793.1 hypothetical protein [Halomicroarcula nitratireducens]
MTDDPSSELPRTRATCTRATIASDASADRGGRSSEEPERGEATTGASGTPAVPTARRLAHWWVSDVAAVPATERGRTASTVLSPGASGSGADDAVDVVYDELTSA